MISINQSINQSINHKIDRSINQSIKQSIDRTIERSINQSITSMDDQSINQSIDRNMSLRSRFHFQWHLRFEETLYCPPHYCLWPCRCQIVLPRVLRSLRHTRCCSAIRCSRSRTSNWSAGWPARDAAKFATPPLPDARGLLSIQSMGIKFDFLYENGQRSVVGLQRDPNLVENPGWTWRSSTT